MERTPRTHRCDQGCRTGYWRTTSRTGASLASRPRCRSGTARTCPRCSDHPPTSPRTSPRSAPRGRRPPGLPRRRTSTPCTCTRRSGRHRTRRHTTLRTPAPRCRPRWPARTALRLADSERSRRTEPGPRTPGQRRAAGDTRTSRCRSGPRSRHEPKRQSRQRALSARACVVAASLAAPRSQGAVQRRVGRREDDSSR